MLGKMIVSEMKNTKSYFIGLYILMLLLTVFVSVIKGLDEALGKEWIFVAIEIIFYLAVVWRFYKDYCAENRMYLEKTEAKHFVLSRLLAALLWGGITFAIFSVLGLMFFQANGMDFLKQNTGFFVLGCCVITRAFFVIILGNTFPFQMTGKFLIMLGLYFVFGKIESMVFLGIANIFASLKYELMIVIYVLLCVCAYLFGMLRMISKRECKSE